MTPITPKPLQTPALIRALLSGERRCPCGSEDFHIEPGFFGGVSAQLLGIRRFWCHVCRRHFWLRSRLHRRAAPARGETPQPGAEAAMATTAIGAPLDLYQRLDELDALTLVTDKDASGRIDLSGLDRQLQQSQVSRPGKRSRRGRHRGH